MSQPCPICGKPVDAIRSRFVNVRDGKVVAYDSEECRSAAETRPTQIPVSPVARRTPASGVVTHATPPLESGPVIEIVREPASAPVVAPAPKRATTPVAVPVVNGRTAVAPVKPLAAERTSTGAGTSTQEGGSKRTTLVIALIAVLGAGGAFLVYRFLIKPAPETAQPERLPEQPIAPTPPPPRPTPPPVTAAEAVTHARETLQKNLGSDSPRVQRVAAAALARTGDLEAIKYLSAALTKETSDVSRLDLAYALARAGDKKGLDTLVTGLASTRRDVRAQAGRQLALVGDHRAVPVLASYLEVSQLRLGAAEQLAFLADPAAIKALDQIRADPKATPDEKARATIALAIAGRSDIVPELVVLLKDGRFNAFAASALAQLHDPSAKPVLVEQLAVPSLRVEAARALRRLEPQLDPAPYLPSLLAALPSHKDTEQVQVAEAILLLAGDAGWSERP